MCIRDSWGDDGGGVIDGPDGVVSSRIIVALATIIFPTPHKIQNDDDSHISGVSVWMSLVPAHPDSPWQRAVERLCVCNT